MMNDMFQMELTDEELQQAIGGSGISNAYGSGTTEYANNSSNFATSSFSGNATGYGSSAYGSLGSASGYNGANNDYFTNTSGSFYGYN